MEKGNQPDSGSTVQQATPGGASGAAAGGPGPGGGQGATPDPGPGTGTAPLPGGTPAPTPSGGGGGSQADQGGPKREWERIDRTQNPDGGYSMTETDGNAALRNTTYDAQGNLVSEEIIENTNTGGYTPPAEEPSSRTYETDGGTPPVGGPEPFSDVPPDPSMQERRSWRDLPAQEVEVPGGDRLSLDGKGDLKFSDGETTFHREGGHWVDEAGRRADSATAKRATGALNDLELGQPPINRRD